MAIFLYFVSAGSILPTPVLAAVPAPETTPAPEAQVVNQEVPAEVVADSQLDGVDPNAPCEISVLFPDSIRQWCSLITHYSQKHGLLPDLVAALILQESGGDYLAYSHSGAVGLMQVMPSDGPSASFMCINGPCFSNRPSTEQLQDPEFNISYGTKMLAGLINKYGDIREALKSYGPMNVGYYYADIVLGLQQKYSNQAQ